MSAGSGDFSRHRVVLVKYMTATEVATAGSAQGGEHVERSDGMLPYLE